MERLFAICRRLKAAASCQLLPSFNFLSIAIDELSSRGNGGIHKICIKLDVIYFRVYVTYVT
jgi:hypothetical protein